MSSFFSRTINLIFTLIIALILSASIVSFSNYVANGLISIIIAILVIIVLMLIFYFANNIFDKIKKMLSFCSNLSVKWMALILFLVVSITKVFFCFLFDIDANLHPDMKNYLSFATQIANDGTITENVVSALKWPYEVIFGLFLSPVVKIFGNDTQVVTSFLSFCFAISSVLLFDIIRKYTGKNLAFVGILLFNLLPVGLFETQLLIHENALIFFYIVSFWLLHRALVLNSKLIIKILLILSSAILISFGNKINQGGTVVIISYCIYSLIVIFKNGINLKKVLSVISIILVFIVALFGVSNGCNMYVDSVVDNSKTNYVKSESSIPYGWPIYLGFNYEHSGVWNQEDADTYYKYEEFDNKDEAREYQQELIDNRLQLYKDSPVLLIPHFFNKIKALWGSPFLPFVYDQGNEVNKFIMTGYGGIFNKLMNAVSYLVFILICFINLFSIKLYRKKKFSINPLIQLELMIIGLTMALILFEVMPKYVSYLQIIMFCIALLKVRDFCDNSKLLHNKYYLQH